MIKQTRRTFVKPEGELHYEQRLGTRIPVDKKHGVIIYLCVLDTPYYEAHLLNGTYVGGPGYKLSDVQSAIHPMPKRGFVKWEPE